MRISLALLLSSVMISPALAQEATQEPLPAPDAQPNMQNPFTLIPEETNTPQPSEPDASAERGIATSKPIQSVADLKQRIHYREVKTRALNDDVLHEIKTEAALAKTNPEKREALKKYYARLCDRIVRIDGSLKTIAERRRNAATARMRQNRFADKEPPSDESQNDDVERPAGPQQ